MTKDEIKKLHDARNRMIRECIKQNLPIHKEWFGDSRNKSYPTPADKFIIYITPIYNRAKRKWAKYKKLTNRSDSTKTPNYLWLNRKDKTKGFVPKNIIITNPSESAKSSNRTHKYIFENKLLGTRDIKNILKQKGINISMESIVKRLNNNKNLFDRNKTAKFKFDNQLLSLVEISKKINVPYDNFRTYVKRKGLDKALKYYKIKIKYPNQINYTNGK